MVMDKTAVQAALVEHGAALADVGECGLDGLPCGVCDECLEEAVLDCDVCWQSTEPVVTQDATTHAGHVLNICRHCAAEALTGSPVRAGTYKGEIWA